MANESTQTDTTDPSTDPRWERIRETAMRFAFSSDDEGPALYRLTFVPDASFGSLYDARIELEQGFGCYLYEIPHPALVEFLEGHGYDAKDDGGLGGYLFRSNAAD